MRLADIKGERAVDVIVELIDPISRISKDENAADLFRRRKLPDGVPLQQFAEERLTKGIPALLKGHRQDVIKILSIIKGEPEESIVENMSPASLISDVADLLTDDYFRLFFGFAQTKTEASESAPKNTEETETPNG